MFYEWAGGEYRQPCESGERTRCRCCSGQLIGVVPRDNQAHWRHKARDCDPWSEPEGEWHLAWKERFPPAAREVPMVDQVTQERHRADIFHNGTVVELQHSPISEKERDLRDAFYTARGRMFWLVHLHDENSLTASYFKISYDPSLPMKFKGRVFLFMSWYGPNKQFIEKWKRSHAHVFFDYAGQIFYLATMASCAEIVQASAKGQYALARLSPLEFLHAVGAPVVATA